MKRLTTFAVCMAMAFGSWAQTTQDFAARFMKDNRDNKEIKCVTVGPKILSSILETHNDEDKKKLKVWMDGMKSVRIVKSENETAELRKAAISLLKANKKRYTLYLNEDKAKYGDCLWVRKVKDQVVELVYVAPASEKSFMVMNFTGKISDSFIEKLVNPEGDTKK